MHARENAIPFNKEVEEFMMRMKLESHAFYRNSLLSIYGEKGYAIFIGFSNYGRRYMPWLFTIDYFK